MAHQCRQLDDECSKLQVIKGVNIDDKRILLQDTRPGGDAVRIIDKVKLKFIDFVQ